MGSLLYLEPVGGIAGDMALAALLDLGVPPDYVRAELRKLNLPGWSLTAEPAAKMGIHGTQVTVRADDHAHERSFGEIRAIIEAAGLTPGARDRAVSAFHALAVAEAHIHRTTVDHVHFHEVGAIDSIVDMVGFAIALDRLAPARVIAAAPPTGGGIAQSRHGAIPVPAPAVVELLKGREVRPSGPGERVTPTGAALLAALTEPGPPPAFTPERVGYGVGHKDFTDAANVLRATIGREGGEGRLLELRCNLDDTSPQSLARALEQALAAGAVDAWIAPITMKKGRPGHLLGALVPEPARAAVAAVLFRETATLGVRWTPVEREVLARETQIVDTAYGPIRVKLGRFGDELVNAAPEWDDCVAASSAHGVPARRVREEALFVWLSRPR